MPSLSVNDYKWVTGSEVVKVEQSITPFTLGRAGNQSLVLLEGHPCAESDKRLDNVNRFVPQPHD